MLRRLRQLRNRTGIRAPRMSIKTHVPWYWRALAAVGVLALALPMAFWIYDFGRRMAGFDYSVSSQEIVALRDQLERLQHELALVRETAATGDSKVAMEKAARLQLAQQVKSLEDENVRLKEDLAFFETTIPVGGEAKLLIPSFKISPETTPGRYAYRFLIVQQGGKKDAEFRGNFQLLAKVQQGGKDAMITYPSEGALDRNKFSLQFKHFHRVEGGFALPAQTVLKTVEVRLVQDGATRASKAIKL